MDAACGSYAVLDYLRHAWLSDRINNARANHRAYRTTNNGKVTTMNPEVEERFWSKINILGPDDCWEWTAKSRAIFGYGLIKIDGVTHAAHRIAYELTYEIELDELCCLHHCDNPPCCNPAHLFIGTKGDNNRDSSKKGRLKGGRGERNRSAVLTTSQVEEILKLYGEGETTAKLAKRFGVNFHIIYKIVHGKLWRHVKRGRVSLV